MIATERASEREGQPKERRTRKTQKKKGSLEKEENEEVDLCRKGRGNHKREDGCGRRRGRGRERVKSDGGIDLDGRSHGIHLLVIL